MADVSKIVMPQGIAAVFAQWVASSSGCMVDWDRSDLEKYEFKFCGEPMACRVADATVHAVMESHRFVLGIIDGGAK